jgi:hypothetical protein
MPGVDKVTERFSSDRASANNSIRLQLQFVIDNIDHLEMVDRRKSKVPLANRLFAKLLDGEDLLDWERTAIDDLYECTMKGYDLPSVSKHIDKKRKRLRFG